MFKLLLVLLLLGCNQAYIKKPPVKGVQDSVQVEVGKEHDLVYFIVGVAVGTMIVDTVYFYKGK